MVISPKKKKAFQIFHGGNFTKKKAFQIFHGGNFTKKKAFQIFHGGNFTFINSFDKTKFLFLISPTDAAPQFL